MAVKEKEKTFETMLLDLENIVKELENGNIDLDSAILKYTEAMKLASECSERLTKATASVNKILSENGKLEDFNIED